MENLEILGKLESGATYALRFTETVDADTFEKLSAALNAMQDHLNVKFIVFGPQYEVMQPQDLEKAITRVIAKRDKMLRGETIL